MFTIGVVVLGFAQIWYILSVLVGLAVEGVLRGVWERRRLARRTSEARDHFLVCSYGGVGRQIAAELKRKGRPIEVIDTDEAALREATRDGLLYGAGSATEDETLLRAGIERAGGLITAVATDADNVFVTLSARALRPGLPIVARADNDGAVAKLRRAGATRVVSPYAMAGRQMARLALRPATVDFVETLLRGDDGELLLEDVLVAPGSALVGVAIAEARERALGGATLPAMRRDGRTLAPPPGDLPAAVGRAAQLRTIECACEGPTDG